jgi:FkbM family methyltransferase
LIIIKKIFNRFFFIFNQILNFLEEVRFKKRQVKLPDYSITFDIGFNKGSFTKSILKKNKTCKIIAVEANTDLINSSYIHPNIEKVNLICSNINDEYKIIHINDKYLGISTVSDLFLAKSRFVHGSAKQEALFQEDNLFNKTLKIKTITLDKLVEIYGSPFLIKIDVEGYEYEVLKGLTKKVEKITFEWSEEFFCQLEKTINYLQSIGFQKFGVVGYFVSYKKLNNKILHSNKGDPFLIEPDYFSWEEIDLKSYIIENRRINYGMIWAK